MKNNRLCQVEIVKLRQVLQRLEDLSKSDSDNKHETRVSVYSIHPFNTFKDKKTVDSVSDSVRIYLQQDIYFLKEILKER